jgi:hypothetical protein
VFSLNTIIASIETSEFSLWQILLKRNTVEKKVMAIKYDKYPENRAKEINNSKNGGVAIALALPLATVESASAITQVSNLSETLNSGFGFDDSSYIGSSFTTDSNSYTVNSVTARFQEYTEVNLLLNIYSNNSGIPGTLVGQLSTNQNILPGGYNDYVFTPNNSVTLAANTTYWLTGESSEFYGWGNTSSFDQTGAWGIGDGIVTSNNQGTSWTSIPGSEPVQFSIDADVASAAVPFEFSPTMGLLLVGGLFGGKAAYGKYRASKLKL